MVAGRPTRPGPRAARLVVEGHRREPVLVLTLLLPMVENRVLDQKKRSVSVMQTLVQVCYYVFRHFCCKMHFKIAMIL